jgi:hypothetical protein
MYRLESPYGAPQWPFKSYTHTHTHFGLLLVLLEVWVKTFRRAQIQHLYMFSSYVVIASFQLRRLDLPLQCPATQNPVGLHASMIHVSNIYVTPADALNCKW